MPPLAAVLPSLPLRGVARVRPCAPFHGRAVARVALRFAAGAAEGEQRAAVRVLVEELRAVLVAGVEADGEEGEWRMVRVVGGLLGGAWRDNRPTLEEKTKIFLDTRRDSCYR